MIGSFQISISGDKQLNRRFVTMKHSVEDATPAWKSITTFLERTERSQFAQQGVAKSWAPLAQSTVESKRRNGLRPEILRATDALKNSMTKKSSGDAIRIQEPTFMVFGTSVPYAGYHQTGTKRMPQRRVLDLTPEQRIEIMKRLQRFIVTGKAGRG